MTLKIFLEIIDEIFKENQTKFFLENLIFSKSLNLISIHWNSSVFKLHSKWDSFA
jgi:hypothetical protein